MSVTHALVIFLAGAGAGAINTVVGSGTLITFPVLLGLGYAPVVANVSNTVGLIPGSASGAVGYRHELSGQRRRILPLAIASLLGGVTGAVLLLSLPAAAFKAIVPAFIAIALVLIVIQPRMSARLHKRRAARCGGSERQGDKRRPGALAWGGVFSSGVYGGYFGAAQGILLLSVLALSLDDDLQRLNGLKIVLAGLVNLVAGVLFVCVAHVAWLPVVLIAAGSTLGGFLGAHGGRRMRPGALRGVILVVGVVAILRLLG